MKKNILILTIILCSNFGCSLINKNVKTSKPIKKIKIIKKKKVNSKDHEFAEFLKDIKSLKKKKKQIKPSKKPKNLSYLVKAKTPAGLYKEAYMAFVSKKYYRLLSIDAILNTKFKGSVYTDKVLFMKAKLEFSRGGMLDALGSVNEIISNFPLSSKRVSAVYLKGQIYQKLGLSKHGKRSFKVIDTQYPKSKEYFFMKLKSKQKKKKALI